MDIEKTETIDTKEAEVSEGFDEVSSLEESIHESPEGLPTNSDGLVPAGLIMKMSRPDTSYETRGIVFTVAEGKHQRPILFAQQQGSFIASGSKHEILFQRGFPEGLQVGYANFHHWIADQSRSVIVQNAAGQKTDVRRSTGFSRHTFEANGRKLYWQRVKGETRASKVFKPHLECVDEDDNVIAFYTQISRSCCGGTKRKIAGELEIRSDGLSVEEVETITMTLIAVWVKHGKRILQGSQAGWFGGLGAAVMYMVGG